jgi:hypothetical protein
MHPSERLKFTRLLYLPTLTNDAGALVTRSVCMRLLSK